MTRLVGLLSVLAAVSAILTMPAGAQITPAHPGADFQGEAASQDVRRLADWVVATRDNGAMAFVIVDKKMARVLVFSPQGRLRGAAPALLGLARGDSSAPGIGDRKLSAIRPEERTTPAGRFVSSLGQDLGDKDIIWVDYDAAISLHRVVTANVKERRLQRLATTTAADNRISYGCINVEPGFYDLVVRPAFIKADGVVYILPEAGSVEETFMINGATPLSTATADRPGLQ